MNLLFKLIRAFKKANGRSPTPGELAELQKQAMAPKSADIIKFPEGGRDRVPVNEQFGGIGSLDKFKKSEDAYEEGVGLVERIKAGLSTKIKLNSAKENRQFVKDLIGGKNDEFNKLKPEDRKEVLDQLQDQITMDDTEIPFAKGGLANMLRL